VFCRTAALNFDVKKFFHKWLGDLRADQRENGAVGGICPDRLAPDKIRCTNISAAWGDVATIIPWEIYRAYGDKNELEANFELMRKWVEYQHSAGSEEFLWLGG
jgi:alpha-L-rhamnosidase